MNGNTITERNEAQDMAALRSELNHEAGRYRLRAALRDVLERLERNDRAVRLLRFGVHATAWNVLRSRPADGDLAPMDRRFVYEALGAVMEDVVRCGLIPPTDAAYVNAMDAMDSVEGGRS